MKTIIFVRYGEHENGHLTKQGRDQMKKTAHKLSNVLQATSNKVMVVASCTSRASETGEIISEVLNCELVANETFYAAEEEGKLPEPEIALNFINGLNDQVDTLIVVASREYIEILPGLILDRSLRVNLGRGECFKIDLEKSEIFQF